MGIGATKSEAVDADSIESIFRERGRFDRHMQLSLLEWDLRVRDIELDIRWDSAIFQGHDCLDKRYETGSTFSMAHVWLDRSNMDTARFFENISNCVGFDGVSNGGAGPMTFEIRCLGEILEAVSLVSLIKASQARRTSTNRDTGHLVGFSDHGLMGFPVGLRNPLRFSIGVCHGGSDNRAHGVSISQGSIQRLDVDGCNSFASGVPIRISRKGLA